MTSSTLLTRIADELDDLSTVFEARREADSLLPASASAAYADGLQHFARALRLVAAAAALTTPHADRGPGGTGAPGILKVILGGRP